MRRRVLLLAVVVVGCSKPLEAPQCNKVLDRMVDLLAKGDGNDRADKVKRELKSDPRSIALVKEHCVGKWTESQYECVMSAKTFQAAVACDGK